MEVAMSRSAQANERPGFARRLAHWWRSWNGSRRTMADLDGCGPAEMERIARDVGVSGADLSILAGKWPDAADQLYWRMSEIKLDRIWKSRTPIRKSCEIFSGYARSAEANGGASTSSQRIRPIRLGKNIAQTRRRSRHWPLREPPKPRQIRCYKALLVGLSSR